MSTSNIENNVTIIGAGLVGGAVLRELVSGWTRTQKEQETSLLDTQLQYSEIGTISFTARSKSKLIYQIQKTKDVLSREEGIIVEQDNPLTFTISSGSHCLRIEADLLDILPKGLTSSTIDDEKFKKASSLYFFLANKRPKILITGVNLAAYWDTTTLTCHITFWKDLHRTACDVFEHRSYPDLRFERIDR